MNIEKYNKIFIAGDYAPINKIKFDNFRNIFSPGDLFFLNYEGVSEAINLEKKVSTFCPIINNDFLKELVENKILVFANLCNNHSLDYGLDGLNHTIKSLININVIPFGLEHDLIDKTLNFFMEGKIINISSEINPKIIEHYKKLNLFYFYKNQSKISKKNFHRNILFLHSGTEFVNYPNFLLYRKLKNLSQKKIDTFVCQQHVTLPVVQNKKILTAFGLGNFAFDCKMHDFSNMTKKGQLIELSSDFSCNKIYIIDLSNSKISIEKTSNYQNKFFKYSFSKWCAECSYYIKRRRAFYSRKSIKKSKVNKINIFKSNVIQFIKILLLKSDTELYLGLLFDNLLKLKKRLFNLIK